MPTGVVMVSVAALGVSSLDPAIRLGEKLKNPPGGGAGQVPVVLLPASVTLQTVLLPPKFKLTVYVAKFPAMTGLGNCGTVIVIVPGLESVNVISAVDAAPVAVK